MNVRRFIVRQGRAFDERRMGKLHAPYGQRLINQLITTHFQYTPGIQASLVVDGKNASVCIADKLSGFTMPLFEMVTQRSAHV